ncbi:hypothetical protein [Arthrobacter sp. STN4]|uniref:hypothetical protein n=1 Tax=Arthrobacter sp. STN4 TaxID=2923276 RepID=UPI00211A55E2|nr:hypothetical protein [Arthrobacter sp. STN4]MCQ9163924.1 hypothetical protein [Arthrobacter sp. STN4]
MDEDESFEYDVANGAEDNFAALLFGSTKGLGSKRVPITYRWRDMDPRTAEHVWDHLGRWVHWLVETYHLPTSVIPDCWWRHSEIVAELYALQRAEQASYTEDDGGFGPLGFHERLEHSIARLRDLTRTAGCVSLQTHREPPLRRFPTTGPGMTAPAAEKAGLGPMKPPQEEAPMARQPKPDQTES